MTVGFVVSQHLYIYASPNLDETATLPLPSPSSLIYVPVCICCFTVVWSTLVSLKLNALNWELMKSCYTARLFASFALSPPLWGRCGAYSHGAPHAGNPLNLTNSCTDKTPPDYQKTQRSACKHCLCSSITYDILLTACYRCCQVSFGTVSCELLPSFEVCYNWRYKKFSQYIPIRWKACALALSTHRQWTYACKIRRWLPSLWVHSSKKKLLFYLCGNVVIVPLLVSSLGWNDTSKSLYTIFAPEDTLRLAK